MSELLRSIFQASLGRLKLSLLQAKDWINSRLVVEGKEYSYEQLYRFSLTGLNKKSARKTIDRGMVRTLARIEFWWDEAKNRPYTEKEIEDLLIGDRDDYNKPQLSLLELEEVRELRPRIAKLSKAGVTALLADEQIKAKVISIAGDPVSDRSLNKSAELEFYRLKNWLTLSLDKLGRPGQPRTAAQERGYKGRIGENLNLVFEGDRGASLTHEDYIAASYILLRIKGWSGVQPIFMDIPVPYSGDWQKMLLDLRRSNGHPASR